MKYQLDPPVRSQRTLCQIIVSALLLMTLSGSATALQTSKQTDNERKEAAKLAKEQSKEEELLRKFTYLDAEVVTVDDHSDWEIVYSPTLAVGGNAIPVRKFITKHIDYEVEVGGKIYSFTWFPGWKGKPPTFRMEKGQKIKCRLDDQKGKFIVMIPKKGREEGYKLNLVRDASPRKQEASDAAVMTESENNSIAFIRGTVFLEGRSIEGTRVELARILADGTAKKIDERTTNETGSFVFRVPSDKAMYRLTAERRASGTGSKDLQVDGADIYHAAVSLATSQTALNVQPKTAEEYFRRGLAYADKGDLDRAIQDYSKAISLDLKNLLAYQNRAKAYRALGKNDLADEDEKQVKELSRQEP